MYKVLVSLGERVWAIGLTQYYNYLKKKKHTHTHTLTSMCVYIHTYIYIYIYNDANSPIYWL